MVARSVRSDSCMALKIVICDRYKSWKSSITSVKEQPEELVKDHLPLYARYFAEGRKGRRKLNTGLSLRALVLIYQLVTIFSEMDHTLRQWNMIQGETFEQYKDHNHFWARPPTFSCIDCVPVLTATLLIKFIIALTSMPSSRSHHGMTLQCSSALWCLS